MFPKQHNISLLYIVDNFFEKKCVEMWGEVEKFVLLQQ